MHSLRKLLLIPLVLWVSGAALYAMTSGGSRTDRRHSRTDLDTVDIRAANAYLARTLNIAFTFDAPKEGLWGHTLQFSDFKTIKDAGFTAVRLPIQWVSRMNAAAPFTIEPAFLARIDSAIQWALDNHLAIILDNHLDEQLMNDPATYRGRFLSLWTQLSQHYKGAPQQVMFEVMAEPHAKLDSAWNQYFSDALSIIRQTNPTRPVIVGPRLYNMAFTLGSLQLPQDDYLILTFHYYNPVKFTMQGEEWFPMGKPKEWIGTTWTGTDQEKNDINHAMDLVADWAKKNNRPVFLGEFGAGDHADSLSRARYFGYIREQAEMHGFSWGFFNFSVQFSLYDQPSHAWHEGLLRALIPGIPN